MRIGIRDLGTVNIRTKTNKFINKILIAAFNIRYLLYFGNALCSKARNDHRRTCTQVKRADRSCLQFRNALDNRNFAIDMNVCAHADKLIGITIAVIPNAFLNAADAIGKTVPFARHSAVVI